MDGILRLSSAVFAAFIVLALFTPLLATMSTGRMPVPVEQPSSILFEDNYDWETEPNAPTNWTNDGVEGLATFEIDSAQANSGSQSMKMVEDTDAFGLCHRDYASGWTNQTMNTSFYMDNINNELRFITQNETGDLDASKCQVWLEFETGGDIHWYDGTWQTSATSWTASAWHWVEIIQYHSNDTFSAWYDDTNIVWYGGFRVSGSISKSFHLQVVNRAGTDVAWIDDVQIGVASGSSPVSTWTDANTQANPTASDMDGSGTPLNQTTGVYLATKSLTIDQNTTAKNMTLSAGTLTINSGKTLADIGVYNVAGMTNNGGLIINGTAAQDIISNGQNLGDVNITNTGGTISLKDATTAGNMTIAGGVTISLENTLTAWGTSWNGALGNEISISSSAVSTIRAITLQGGNKWVNYTNATNCYYNISQGTTHYFSNFNVFFADDGDGSTNAAIELYNLTSGTYDYIEIYQATYGLAFTGTCSIEISNLTITECGKGDGSSQYASGGSIYLTNNSHNITLTNPRVDFEHIGFEGTLGWINTTENKKLIAVVGDSIVQGSTLHGRFWNKFAGNDDMTNQWPRRLIDKLDTDYYVLNLGEGGDRVADVASRIGGITDTEPEYIIIAVGTNDNYDITQATQTRAGLWDDYHDLFTQINNASIDYYVCAICPTDKGATREAETTNTNTWLENNATTYGYTFINETYDNIIEGGGDNTLKEAYDADDLHLNSAGYEQVATDVATYFGGTGAPTYQRNITSTSQDLSNWSIDTTPPQINSVADAPDPVELYSPINITANITDAVGVTVHRVNITWPSGVTTNATLTSAGSDIYYYSSGFSLLGNYSYFIWVNDSSGNGNKSSTYYFTVTYSASGGGGGGDTSGSLDAKFTWEQVGKTVIFNYTGDPGRVYRWSFGDGQGIEGEDPTHRYASYGTYTVKVEVENARGEKFYAEREVDVKARLVDTHEDTVNLLGFEWHAIMIMASAGIGIYLLSDGDNPITRALRIPDDVAMGLLILWFLFGLALMSGYIDEAITDIFNYGG